MVKKYPFKFLNSYGLEDRDIFFGRDQEIEALYEMVFQVPIMVVYGASGTGKTSLIQCGLASRFNSVDWLALTIRRGSNINESLEKVLMEFGGKDFHTKSKKVNEHAEELTQLQQLIRSVYLKNFKPIYLIFDQFEELYIMGNSDEQRKFIESVKEILHAENPVKMIFSIREEYLGHMFDFEKEVPQLFNKKLRVEPMDLEKVKTVIKEIGRSPLSLVTMEAGKEDLIAESIFKKVRGEENTLTIQLPYLQVFLDKLYRDNAKDQNYRKEWKFTLAEVDSMPPIDKILYEFLDKVVKDATKTLGQKEETIWEILSPFVTLEGTKKPLSAEELDTLVHNENNLNKEALKIFEDSRILRYIEKDELYEIAHDALAKQVKAKQSVEIINILKAEQLIKSKFAFKDRFHRKIPAEELDFIKPYESNLKLDPNERAFLEESKRARDRSKRFKIITQVLIFGVITAGLLYFIRENSKNLEIHDLNTRLEKIYDLFKSATTNNVLALANAEKDPTLALQLEKNAFDSLDNAFLLRDSVCKKSYKYKSTNELKVNECNNLNALYDSLYSMLEVQTNFLLKQDNALYKIRTQKLAKEILNPRFVNVIFPDKKEDSIFSTWHAEDTILSKIYGTNRDDSLTAVFFPTEYNTAMVRYSNGKAGYFDSTGLYRGVRNSEYITSLAPVYYSEFKYKILLANLNREIEEWNLYGSQRVDSTIRKEVSYKYYSTDKINNNIISIAIKKDRSGIFAVDEKGMGAIWTTDKNKINLNPLTVFNVLQDSVRCSAFSNDGLLIATGSKDNSVKIWDAENGNLLKILSGHTRQVTSVAFSAKDSFVYTGSLDGTFRQWRLPTKDPISKKRSGQWNESMSIDNLFKMNIKDSSKYKSSK